MIVLVFPVAGSDGLLFRERLLTAQKPKYYIDWILVGFLFIINFLWFSGLHVTVLMGDDLQLLNNFKNSDFFSFVFATSGSKYRPVFSLIVTLFLQVFGAGFQLYYLTNMVINCAAVLMVYTLLKNVSNGSSPLSFIFSVLFITSRFAYYYIYQLFGLMESVALLFLLAFLLNAWVYLSEKGRRKHFWLMFIFLALMVFTHERYIVVLPFAVLAALFKREKQFWKRILFALVICAPVVLLFVLKLFVFQVNTLEGTGGVDIGFDIRQILDYMSAGFMNIIGLNSGPAYLFGADSMNISRLVVASVYFGLAIVIILVVFHALSMRRKHIGMLRQELAPFAYWLVLILSLVLAASITIRQEPRWLLAPFVVFIVLLAYMVSRISRLGELLKICLASLLALSMLYGNIHFKYQADNIYFMYSMQAAESFYGQSVRKYGEDLNRFKKVFVLDDLALQWVLGGQDFLDTYAPGSNIKTVYVNSAKDIPAGEVIGGKALVLTWSWSSRSMIDITAPVAEALAEEQHKLPAGATVSFDFVKNFESTAAFTPDGPRSDTPGGFGVFIGTTQSALPSDVLTVLSGYTVQFRGQPISADSMLLMRYSLLWPNSDGARLKVLARDEQGNTSVILEKDVPAYENGSVLSDRISLKEFSGKTLGFEVSVESPSGDDSSDWIGISDMLLYRSP
jgi:hypothetical protein